MGVVPVAEGTGKKTVRLVGTGRVSKGARPTNAFSLFSFLVLNTPPSSGQLNVTASFAATDAGSVQHQNPILGPADCGAVPKQQRHWQQLAENSQCSQVLRAHLRLRHKSLGRQYRLLYFSKFALIWGVGQHTWPPSLRSYCGRRLWSVRRRGIDH